MDTSPERMDRDLPLDTSDGHMDGAFVVDHSSQPSVCFLCRKILAPDNQATDDLETTNLCGDCKFLLLEDLATPEQYSRRRRRPYRSRRNRPSSSESIENLFSQEFSQMVNMVRQNQSTSYGHGDRTQEADAAPRSFQHTSSLRTPSVSRRWRRILSDSESDGFDNLESLYWDSESNVSFSRYRVFHGDSDTVSFSAYGGDSDDGHTFLDGEIFANPDNGSNFDSSTDIDPMHAGLDQWNWDDPDGEGEEDGEWEEADAEDDTVGFTISRAGLQNMFISSPSERNFTANNFPISFRHARGFEQLLDHLAESDSLRRGAPPASVSYVNNLPLIIVSEEREKHDGLVCAICKDVLTAGTEVSKLPCSHLYHPSCILPWLSARNSCPLCRFELPTDDKDYEEGKHHSNTQIEIPEIQEQDASEDGYSENSSEAEAACELGLCTSGRTEVPDVDTTVNNSVGESGRDWYFQAVVPIVGIVGMVLVLWLGRGQGLASHCNLPAHCQHSSPSLLNQRGNRSRRWFFF